MAEIDWNALRERYDDMVTALASSTLERKEREQLQRKASQYLALLTKHDEVVEIEKQLRENEELAADDRELAELYEEEMGVLRERLADAQVALQELLYPADERDNRSVFLEIRAGAGGAEAALFVADLFKMYSTYAVAYHWVVSVVSVSETDLGGYKELTAHIKGKNVYKHLKFESGVHRVQRVPATETQGRVHTSTVTVAVLPEVEEVEVDVNPTDLRIDVYRSSGAGGQHVNTTDSAVRITHVPTGIVVTCQDERSQIKNKAKAMKVLKARIFEEEKRRLDAERSAQRKEQVGSGERAEKIRTYNFPQNRVTDHRTNVTLKKLDLVMLGDLDDLLRPLLQWDLKQRESRGSFLLD